MSTMVKVEKTNHYVRICPNDPKKIERSGNGRSWCCCFSGSSSVGEFQSLLVDKGDIIAQTSKGTYRSLNSGGGWTKYGS